MNKIKVGLIYGGNSFEHDVSLMTARAILENIDRKKFETKKIYIKKDGRFDESLLESIDVAFLAVHGPNCEDGKLQAFLEDRGVKYTGCGVKASRMNMDKYLMHESFLKIGLPVVSYLSFGQEAIDRIRLRITQQLKFPIFVKPNNAGSSVGISVVEREDELDLALKKAFEYDQSIFVEEGVKSPREFKIGILGNEELIVSAPGEILSNGQFYSYETKYLNPFPTIVRVVDLKSEEAEELKKLAVRAYKGTGCCGYARVDFLMDQNRKFYVNEINTLPGFTETSMFPKLMQNIGISYKDLITQIINLALEG